MQTDIISFKKIEWAIDTFNSLKAPGIDGIIPAMLQVTKAVITPWLLKIYNACLRLGYVPIKWRTSRIVFLTKAGKFSHMTPKDYRPISLTSFLLKTLEKLLVLHIRNDVGRLMSERQHAYTNGKSVEHALHSLIASNGHLWSI